MTHIFRKVTACIIALGFVGIAAQASAVGCRCPTPSGDKVWNTACTNFTPNGSDGFTQTINPHPGVFIKVLGVFLNSSADVGVSGQGLDSSHNVISSCFVNDTTVDSNGVSTQNCNGGAYWYAQSTDGCIG